EVAPRRAQPVDHRSAMLFFHRLILPHLGWGRGAVAPALGAGPKRTPGSQSGAPARPAIGRLGDFRKPPITSLQAAVPAAGLHSTENRSRSPTLRANRAIAWACTGAGAPWGSFCCLLARTSYPPFLL